MRNRIFRSPAAWLLALVVITGGALPAGAQDEDGSRAADTAAARQKVASERVSSPDTLIDGGIVFTHPEEDDESLTPAERIQALNARLRDNPADGKSWNDLGVLNANEGNYDVARDAFINAVQVDPTNGDYHRNLGLVFSRLGMHEMAVAEFGQYRRNDEMGGRDYWRLIGGAQLEAGMTADARVTLREGIAAMEPGLGPEGFRLVLALNQLENDAGEEQAMRDLLQKYSPTAIAFLASFAGREDIDSQDGVREARSVINNRVKIMVDDGKLMEQSGLNAEAARIYKQAYELAPERDDLLPRLVDVYIREDKTLDAGVAARMARNDHPDKAGTWIATAKVYENANKLDEAVAAYEKAYEIEKIDDVRVAIGNLHMRLGNDSEASKWLKAGISGTDTKPEVVYNYAVSLIREKKYNAAIPPLRNVVRDLPEMYQAWLALAQCLQATKQYSQAIEPYEKAFALQPDPKLAFHLGSSAMKADQHDTAIAAYQTALELDPNYTKAQYNLALTYMDARRYEEAAAAFDQLVVMEGESYRAYYSQGLAYYYLGNYDAALESYDMALAQRETVNVLNNIGLVYDKLGKKKEAASWYKQAADKKGGK
jgi:tetratricopeptide (TPR) repeat protein